MTQQSRNFALNQQSALSGVKGHMCVKSSPFAPTQNKLSSQYMILDQMNSHYRKVLNAKSSIDTKSPKAWSTSQKSRDTAKRKALIEGKPSPQRVNERSKSAIDQSQAFTIDDFNEGTSVHDMALVESLVNGTGDELNNNEYKSAMTNGRPVTADRVQRQLNNTSRMSYGGSPRNQHEVQSNMQSWTKSGSLRTAATPQRVMGGDLLDTKSHKFVEASKPFTPRTLKNDRTSALSKYKYYRPPKQKPPKKIPEGSRSDTPQTDNIESMMLDETLMSRDFNRLRSSGTVPPLDISLDSDHMKWLKEQSASAQKRMQQNERLAETQREYTTDPQLDLFNDSNKANKTSYNNTGAADRGLQRQTSSSQFATRPSSAQTFSRSYSSGTMQRVQDEEEELKYLNFITDVTNDVLTRGIFTNRVLKQVFEHHIQKRKGELKVSRMRALLDTLREDLGITDDETDGVGMGTGCTDDIDVPKPHPHDRTIQPRYTKNTQETVSHHEDIDFSSLRLDTIESIHSEDIKSETSFKSIPSSNKSYQRKTSFASTKDPSNETLNHNFKPSNGECDVETLSLEITSSQTPYKVEDVDESTKPSPRPRPRLQKLKSVESQDNSDIASQERNRHDNTFSPKPKSRNISVASEPSFDLGSTIKPAKRSTRTSVAKPVQDELDVLEELKSEEQNTNNSINDKSNDLKDDDAYSDNFTEDEVDFDDDDIDDVLSGDQNKTLNRTYSKEDIDTKAEDKLNRTYSKSDEDDF